MFRHIEATRHGAVDVVTVLETRLIDDPHLDDLRAEIGKIVGDRRGAKLLLDLGSVEFLSSATLEMLSTFYRALHASGGQLRLCRVTPPIAEVFRTTKLDRLFPIHADVEEAMAHF